MIANLVEVVQRFSARNALFGRLDKRLRMAETISLGSQGFLALVQVDGQEMLVGGAGHSISVLAKRSAQKSATKKKMPPTWLVEPSVKQ